MPGVHVVVQGKHCNRRRQALLALLFSTSCLQAGLAVCFSALQCPRCPGTAVFAHLWGPVAAALLVVPQDQYSSLQGAALQQHQAPGILQMLPFLRQMSDLQDRITEAAAGLVATALQVGGNRAGLHEGAQYNVRPAGQDHQRKGRAGCNCPAGQGRSAQAQAVWVPSMACPAFAVVPARAPARYQVDLLLPAPLYRLSCRLMQPCCMPACPSSSLVQQPTSIGFYPVPWMW